MIHSFGKLVIDLQALRDNYDIISKKIVSDCIIAPVVKANSYGLGMVELSHIFHEKGARNFFVATPEEGLILRQALPESKIFVLGGFYKNHMHDYLSHTLSPVLGGLEELDAYRDLALEQNQILQAFLHFDTGMNRLGLSKRESIILLNEPGRMDGLNICGVMSHFACAEEDNNPMNEIQYESFMQNTAHFSKAQKSLCNSPGLFQDQRYHFDMVRPGMALYGLNPTPGKPNPMKPVIRLEIPVIRMRTALKGESAGYNSTYRFEQDTRLAIISVGYADGVFRSLSNRAVFYWKGYACPVRGQISMDTTNIDLSAIPENKRPNVGDYVELLGPFQNADDLANIAGTIGYEILTSLGARYKRHYINS